MGSEPVYCEALTAKRFACFNRANHERDGRPVCHHHARAESVLWQGTSDERFGCPTCHGAGLYSESDWGAHRGSPNVPCPDCYGEGWLDHDPATWGK